MSWGLPMEPPEPVERCGGCGRLVDLIGDEYVCHGDFYYHIECWDEDDDDE